MTHPGYPPGVGLLAVVSSWPRGIFDGNVMRCLGALFVLAPAVWLHAALRERSRAAALVGPLLWLSLPILYYIRLPHDSGPLAAVGLLLGPELGESLLGGENWRTTDGAGLDGGGDLPTAAFLFGLVVHLWRWLGHAAGDRVDGLVAALMCAGLLLAKNEGAGLALVLLIAVALARLLEARLLPSLPVGVLRSIGLGLAVVALAFVAIGPWLEFRRDIPEIDESYHALVSPAGLFAALTAELHIFRENIDLPIAYVLGREFLATFLDPLAWNLNWVLFWGAIGVACARPRQSAERGALLPLLVVLGGLALFFLVLAVTPWNLMRLFNTGIPDRLFLQLMPVAIFGTLLVIWGAPGTAGPVLAEVAGGDRAGEPLDSSDSSEREGTR